MEKDPTAFFSLDEFEKGVSTLKEFCILRSESITLQLNNGETDRNVAYVDGTTLSLSDMGSMGGGFGGGRENFMNRVDAAVPSFDMSSVFGDVSVNSKEASTSMFPSFGNKGEKGMPFGSEENK